MQKILTVAAITTTILLASCGSGVKTPDTLEGKKKQLTMLKDQQTALAKQIDSLESQISRLDTSSKVGQKAKLVALSPVTPSSFAHFIDLQGNVEAENNSYVSPRTPGVAKAVYVKKGDHVRQGQLLVKLDDALQRTNVANAQIQLDHAKDLYQRRKNLWDEKIGTEVDLINAKNAVDQAENQLKNYQEQLDFTNVYADISGVIEDIWLKVGEAFIQGSTQIHLVNTQNLKVTVQVPELYQEKVKVGTPVKITLPGLNNKEITGIVHITGRTINGDSRSFTVEIKLPASSDIRSNQVALVRLQDYNVAKTLAIPVNTLQTDDKGKYVMVATKDKENNLLAHKKAITIGQSYGDKVEVIGGLQEGDQLITDGFQGLYEGQLITIQ
ncbi:efflux RND transporter periplasmic adaptor subunit [Flavitalea sp. BT771]|uniref:efflux RND transporter periplasmic adaptor subunit n=1 Tax=Flavitalea sp. BT771 TaxID=3063329 RepID=UPI0026E2DFF0|nr:efflux RND transporter periplasmic adaptor subunit [Flavitalea sp. BT771]MDO6433748.1 efflux RND transporter periplasmic adaptor subunit [Flavitalea sp. BT771]MDV6222347.1 efflux RND transporter periplasmic adaptor subunit [Flavitalea sp. BT771]